VVAQTPRITFTVTDPTLDDEITFYYEIDGIRESESGVPNSPFNVSLREGIHSYTVYAIDKAGNKSSTLTQKITYLGASIWAIKMRKPAGDVAINLPPSAPDNSYKPIYTIEFSIENLPDDNIQLIREVVVTNSTTSEILRKRTFMDNSFEFDIGLSLKATNVVIIEALDINNIKKTYKLQIHAR
jgi:hypothetical protein